MNPNDEEHLLRNCIYLALLGVTQEDGYSLPSEVRQQIEDKIVRRFQSRLPAKVEPVGEVYSEMAISFGHWLDRNSAKYRRYTDTQNAFRDHSTVDQYYNIRDLFPIFLEEFPQFKSPNTSKQGNEGEVSLLYFMDWVVKNVWFDNDEYYIKGLGYTTYSKLEILEHFKFQHPYNFPPKAGQ